MLEILERQPQPTVALVNGAAYGGAVGLIAACDIALAAKSARFALSEVRLGLVPAMISPYVIRAMGSATGTALVPDRRGHGGARRRERIGLVARGRDDAALAGASESRWSTALLAGGPGAQAEIKRLLRHVTGRSEAGGRVAAG